jgi:hypothetical protein
VRLFFRVLCPTLSFRLLASSKIQYLVSPIKTIGHPFGSFVLRQSDAGVLWRFALGKEVPEELPDGIGPNTLGRLCVYFLVHAASLPRRWATKAGITDCSDPSKKSHWPPGFVSRKTGPSRVKSQSWDECVSPKCISSPYSQFLNSMIWVWDEVPPFGINLTPINDLTIRSTSGPDEGALPNGHNPEICKSIDPFLQQNGRVDDSFK